ncbi:MAG: glutathione S-transferase [Hyphomicrobium aestuarii]|nr:glutathione S-transferase [Hyphomicrobium aestuarii]
MKIIETRTAPNARRVRIFLAEKGLELEREHRELDSLRSPEFTKLNPYQRVPILVLDDGTVIAETIAICRYLEELRPEPALFGRGALGKARVEMQHRRVEFGLYLFVQAAFRHLHPSMVALEAPQIPAWGEANKGKALAALELLDQQLATTRYLAGDDYSVADITALVIVDFMRPARIARPPELIHVERWYKDVTARPSATA